MAVNSPPVSVGSDLVSPLSLPPDLRQQISGSTAATQAITAPVPPTNSLDTAKPGDTVTLTPEQQAEFDKSAGIVNPIRDLSAEQIAELAKTNPEFSIVNEYATQPDLSSDPAIADKVAHAWNLYKQTPFKLPAISDVAKNIWGFAKSAAQRGAIAGKTILPADLGGYQTPQEVRQAQGEAIGGSELGVSGLVNFAKHIGQSAARGMRLSTPLKDQSNSEQLEAFGQALAENHAQQSILAGKGPLLGTAAGQAAQANAEPLRPQKISELAASDPFSFAAASGAFGLAGKAAGLGGKVISAITPEAVSAPVASLISKLPTAGQAAATVVGRGLEKTADLTQMGTTLASKITPAAGAIIGGLKAENFGHTGIGIFGGYKAGQVIANSLGKLGGLMEPVAKAGREIAGVEPVTSNIAQLGKDIVTATPSALGALGKGYAFDAGLSAMAETPEEARGSVGFGTAFGALGGAEGIARHAISGQIIAPRAWGSNFPVASSGQFPALEAMHNEAYSAAEPGVKARLNAIRSFTQGLPNAADVFYGKDSGAVTKALTQMGMTPEAAAAFGEQKGFFTTDLPGKDGTNKRVIVVRDVSAAPHEAIHALDDVLGEDANRKFDDFIKQEYGADWENIGQDYAERLTGGKIPEGQTWRDAVLNSSRWGVAEAGDKLYSQTAEKLKAQTGAEPTPDEIKTASKQDWNARLTAASGDENAVVRGILTPEELSATADRYIAREIKAEAGDALIKSGGTGFKGPQGIIPKLARTVGNVISLFGGEPLAGRTSEVGKIPLKADVINRLSSEAQGIIPEPKKAERPTIVPATPAGRGIPATPEAAAAAGTEAKDIAAAAPAEIPVGGTKSPRELLGAIAEAIAQRAGVKINYLSAPEEPAAATTSNRPLRRQMIELYRSMPDAARGLWEKSFFPERVLKTKSGYQVLGWSPEVFAANAHKMAGSLLKLPDAQSLSPYELDPKTGSFSERGWKDLYTDVTQFVKNQQAGRTGAGEPLIVPKVTADKGFNAPQILGGESPLDQRKADFVSMLYNFKLPETPRITGGKLPLNIAGQEISAATKPGRVEIPVRPRGSFEGEAAQKLGIEGKPILEVNPVRNEIERAAQAAGQPMPSLIEAIQRLDLNHIKEVAVAPELPQFRGNSLTLTAGFQPESVHDSMEKMKGFSPEEFNALKSFSGKHGGGITGWAFDVGSQVKSEADLAALRSARDTMRDMGKEAMKNKDFDLAANYFTRSQAAREAFEFATGRQIDDESKVSGSAEIVRKKNPDSMPPMSAGGIARPDEFIPPTKVENVQPGTTGQFQPLDSFSDEEARAIPGGVVSRPERTYQQASQEATARRGNPYIRRSINPADDSAPSNADRTLLVQITSDLMNPGGNINMDLSKEYYDKVYSGARPGYTRMDDFWEIPQWMGFASHIFPKADAYVVRSMAEAKQFLNSAGYKNVMFSSLDVNKAFIKELAQSYPGKVDVGGWTDPKYYDDTPNVTWHNDLKSAAGANGVPYKDGVDYRHFEGSGAIPRLNMSTGCKYQCAFCSVEKAVKQVPPELINQQADEIAKLGTELVYLGDKTFGQSPNYTHLADLNTAIKAKNPNFKGFVVQTTASTLPKLTPEWLAKSGIKFVELGIETYNDPILRAMQKPATEALMDKSADALRKNGIALIPNIIIGLPGETPETYARTLDFMKRNADIISHANIYNLAIYKDAKLGKEITTASPDDFNENILEKSFHANPEVHRQFAGDLYGLAAKMLDKPISGQAQPGSQPEPPHIRDADELWTGAVAMGQNRENKQDTQFQSNESNDAEKLTTSSQNYTEAHGGAQFQPRELATPDAEKRFAGSKVRFEDGTLKPVFHGTVNSFDPTEIDTRGFSAHFGSPDAAATRIIGGSGEKSQSALTATEGHKLMPTFLDIRKPLRLRDASNWDDARSVAEEINRKLGPEALRRAGLPPINAIDGAIEGRANDLMDIPIADRRSDATDLPRSMQSIDPINHPPEYAIANYEILDKLKQYLKSRGYDGIVYENAFENEPPMIRRNVTSEPLSYTGQRDYNADSYIPFDSDQVHSAIPPKIGGQFSPSKAPKAIRAAALKSDDGRIFEGYNHPDAYEKMLPGYLRDHEFVEGFTDNQGKFLTREEAYERAVKHKQFDESKDYNDDYIAPGELAAESLKNRGAQFQPSDHPDASKAAAVRDKDGVIYSGAHHLEAYQNATKAGVPLENFDDAGVGFVTNSGEYLNREQAFQRAKKLKQFRGPEFVPGELASENLKPQFSPGHETMEEKNTLRFNERQDRRARGYWISPVGGLRLATGTHESSARKLLGMPPAEESDSTEGRARLFDKGWARVVVDKGPFPDSIKTIFIEPRDYGKANRAQLDALTKLAIEHEHELRYDPGAGPKEPIYTPPTEEQRAQFSPKESDEKWKLARAGGGGFSKAWILPNGEPVQLGGQWHHEWINEHPEEQKRWGLPAGQEGEENRISALKKGFARVNYDNRSGHLTVEAKSSAWRKLNPSVEKLVEANLGSIDRMTVHLMSDSIKKVNDSETVSLFDKGAEKMKNIPFITGSEPTAQFSPKGDPGWVGIVDHTEDDPVRARKVPDLFNQSHESLFGLRKTDSAVRWRYNPKTQAIYWHDYSNRNDKDVEHVKDFLRYSNESPKVVKDAENYPDEAHGIPSKFAHFISPRIQFQPANFDHPDFESELEKIRAGQSGGQTFTPSGAVWQPKSPTDIVSLASVNLPQGELTPEAFHDAVAPYSDLLSHPNVAAGVYSFSKDGKPTVSVDINALVPKKHRDNTLAFAKENDQRDIFDTEKMDSIPAGGKGDTRLTKPEELLDALDGLTRGKPVSVSEIKRQHAEPGEVQEEGTLPGFGGKTPLGTAALGNMTKAEVAQHYPEAVIARRKNDVIPSAITESPLAKEAGSEEKAIPAFARRLVEFANEHKDNPNFQLGAKWYSDFVPALKKEFGADAPLMAELLAATSPRVNPTGNFAYALDALEGLKSGRFKKQIDKFNEGLKKIADDDWEPWYKKELKAGNIPDPPAEPTQAAFLEHWIAKHDLTPRQSNGALYGISSIPVLQVFARRWLDLTQGPKVRNFVSNLLGTGHDATIDVWADRTMRRLGYSGFEPRWRILPQNGAPVSDADFSFSQKAFSEAAKQLGMKPDALQGALWFAEKQHWADNGWGRLDLGSYMNEFPKIPMLKAGIRQRAGLQAKAAKAKPAETMELGLVTPRNLK
jgi:hypothetical protein